MHVFLLAGLVGISALLFFLPRLMKAHTRRRRRTDPAYRPPGSLGVIDEIYHPTAHSTFLEVEAQREVPAPAPAPGDQRQPRHRRRDS